MFPRYVLYFDYLSNIDCKIEYSKNFKSFLHAPVIATCGYYGNRRTKVNAVSPKLCSKITLQEDNNTSW